MKKLESGDAVLNMDPGSRHFGKIGIVDYEILEDDVAYVVRWDLLLPFRVEDSHLRGYLKFLGRERKVIKNEE